MSATLGGVTGVFGLAGFLPETTWTPKTFLDQQSGRLNLEIGGIINGSASRDATNSMDTSSLFPGLLMGLRSSDSLWAPSIIGPTTASASASATTITVGAAMAVELVRRVGGSGTFKIVGPPTSGGTVASETVTYSAVNTSSGAITCTAITNAYISGAFVQPLDGSQTILGILNQETRTTDINGNNQNVVLGSLVVGGVVKSSQLTNWPSDTSLRAYIKAALRAVGYAYMFTDDFGM